MHRKETEYFRENGSSKRMSVQTDCEMLSVQLYIANILTASEAVERLRYHKVNNQVSFHTEKALQYLQLVRRTSYARNDL